MDYTVIRRGSRLKRVIVDRYNVVEPNSRIGFDAAADRPSGPAPLLHAAPPGTARASTSPCSPNTPNGRTVPVRSQRAARSAAHRVARADRSGLALLPARGAPRPALRLPRARPLRPGARPPLQRQQAAARPLRQIHRRPGALERRPFRLPIGHRNEDLSFDRRDNAAGMPKCRVIDPAFTWGDDRPPNIPWHDMVIYELHVRGFTMQHPDVPPACAAPTPAWRRRR
jgi:hypothetical protein